MSFVRGSLMELSAENVARLCARLPEYGRLRLERGVLVLERSFQVAAAGELVEKLAERQPDESLTVQRFPAHWLVTFTRILMGD